VSGFGPDANVAVRPVAVFLSSVLFAAMHAPLFFLQPVIQGDWQLLALVAGNHASVFAMQVLVGLVFGVIWLRTGSIALISILHAVVNIGPALARDW
jgi:membrane protease YdiL (CAAX protease family)